MGKKKKFYKAGDNFYDRKFQIIIYKDSNSYDYSKVLNKISKYDDYEYILHDKDVYIDDKEYINELGEIELHNKGDLKKEHYHVVLKLKNPKWSHTIADELGIPYNFVCYTPNLKDSLLYLYHPNDDDKYEYDLNELHGTLTDKIKKWVKHIDESIDEICLSILEIIYSYEGYLSYTTLTKMICENGLYSQFIRGFSLFKEIVIEHNERVYRKSNYD